MFVKGIALIILGILVVWGIYGFFTTPASTPPVDANKNVTLKDDDWIQGPKQSKLTIIEYSDFQCPACAAYYPILKQLQTDLPNQFTFAYRYFPLIQIHKNGQISAQAAEAAGKQGKFWEMHDLLFENQTTWESISDPRDKFAEYAASLSINVDQFKNDMNSDAVKNKVTQSYAEALALGLNSTPTFFMNGKKLDSPPNTYQKFKDFVNQKLSQ